MSILKAPLSPSQFSRRLLQWHAQHGRHDLPWKKQMTAYRVWVSEIMLQQTQVTTVIPYFQKFMRRFPTLAHLAEAPIDNVLELWSGLGYYARARNLHRAAQIVHDHWHGNFPQTLDKLMLLPGIGRSTAGAILAQAFDIRAPILDGNVKRILARVHCLADTDKKAAEQHLWQLAENYTPKKHVADYTQAIMDLGATLCTRTQPQCKQCPLHTHCQAFNRQEQHLFPTKKRKKTLPVKQVTLLCLWDPKQQLLLQQRPSHGIWGGLWSLPEFASLEEAQQFLRVLGIKKHTMNPLPSLRHTFSHFHLDITPLQIHLSQTPKMIDDPSLLWIKKSNLTKRGLPAPIKKLLQTTMREKAS